MKAVYWKGGNNLCFDAGVPEPECRDDWVKIKVMSAGVCATDLHIIDGKLDIVAPPAILGHEMCGVIVELGGEARGCALGDRVVVETVVSCGRCRHCLTANKHLCAEGKEIGLSGYAGAYAQYVCAPSSCVHKIPDSVSFDEGGIIEAMVCPFGAVYRLGMDIGETVLIQGAGIAGLAFIQAVKCFSPAKIIVSGKHQPRLDMAMKLGADVVIDIDKEDLAERIHEETAGEGVSLSIEATGSAVAIKNAVMLAAKGGRCIFYGLPAGDMVPFPVKDMILNQITAVGVTNNELAWDPLISMIAAGRINARDMITHSFPLEKLDEAIELLRQKPDSLIKAVIHPWE